jgi:hypothetical protein
MTHDLELPPGLADAIRAADRELTARRAIDAWQSTDDGRVVYWRAGELRAASLTDPTVVGRDHIEVALGLGLQVRR